MFLHRQTTLLLYLKICSSVAGVGCHSYYKNAIGESMQLFLKINNDSISHIKISGALILCPLVGIKHSDLFMKATIIMTYVGDSLCYVLCHGHRQIYMWRKPTRGAKVLVVSQIWIDFLEYIRVIGITQNISMI